MLLMNLFAETTSNEGRSVSSDYYGGAYLNDDGNLVVCVTNEYDTDSNAIQAYTNNSDIAIKTVKYAYNELSEEQDRIAEIWKAARANNTESYKLEDASISIHDVAEFLCGTYIDEEKNVLVVEIEELSADKIEAFCKMFSSADFLAFEEGYKTTMTASYLNPGEEIWQGSVASLGRLSAGYPVYFKNSSGSIEQGFITAGHGYNTGDTVYTRTGAVLGVCVNSVCSGNTDAALIRITNSSYDISQTTCYGGVDLQIYGYISPAQGTSLYKDGYKSGQTSGIVESRSCDITYGNVTITDTLKTTVLNLPGDSGGVAYTSYGHVVGSMSGSTFSSKTQFDKTTFQRSYICKIENAWDALDFSLWPCPGDECDDPDCICRN